MSAARGHVVLVTNIPTPYRLHFFRLLHAALQRRGWTMAVWFMADSEPGRHWQLPPGEFEFPYEFFRGVHPRVCGATLHLNPGIPLLAARTAPNLLLIAGGWGLPTNLLLTLVAKLKETPTIFWSESHLGSRRHLGAVIDGLRAVALRLYDGFAVPGPLARSYVQHYAPGRSTFTLPNVVNEQIFGDRVRALRAQRTVLRDRLRVDPARRLLVSLARLNPEKGVLDFVRSLALLPHDITARFTLAIGGDGPLRREIESAVGASGDLDVRLLGQLGEPAVVELLAAADGFVLPSRSEPNPLAAIEALWAGLPLLLSDRVGNHVELLQPARNGWLFDSREPRAMQAAVLEWVEAGDEQLGRYGRASAQIARQNFQPDVIVEGFLDQVIGRQRVSAA